MIADRQKHRTAGTAASHASPKTRRTTGSAPAKSSAAAGYNARDPVQRAPRGLGEPLGSA